MSIFVKNLSNRPGVLAQESHAAAAVAATSVACAPVSDRRDSQRIRQVVQAEITEWVGQRAGRAFRATIHDLSTAGVGLAADERVHVGRQYLLEVPRPGRPPLAAPFTVVRSDSGSGGLFAARLEPDEVLDVAVRASMLRSPVVRRRIRRGMLVASAMFCVAVLAAAYLLYDVDAVLPQHAISLHAGTNPIALR